MRKWLTLLLATAMLCTGTSALASDENEDVLNSEETVTANSRANQYGWGSWGDWSDWGNWGGSSEYDPGVASDTGSNIPSGSAAFFLQLDGLQMDTNGNVSGRPKALFTDIVATAKLVEKYRSNRYSVVIGQGVTEEDVLAEVSNPPSDDDAFDKAREQLMYKGYIRSDKGEVIPWSKLNSKHYGIDWYVFKHEDDGWHIDGRILDLATKDIIDIVVPDDPKDIPPEAYEKEEEKEPEKEEEKDTSINLEGARFAYIFGYEPDLTLVPGEDGSEQYTAQIHMGMNDPVTVEQVSTMLMRLLDQELYTKGTSYKVTSSVEPYRNEWFARGLAYQCTVGGLPEEGDLPLGKISRGMVAKLVSCALKLNLSKDVPFTDVAGNEYEEYIKKAYAYGYMNGVSDDRFAPDSIMTRAEFCMLFNNIIGRNDMGLTALDENGNEYKITAADYSFVDMSPEHWAYEVCLKATSAYDDNGYISLSTRQENMRNILDEFDSQLLY